VLHSVLIYCFLSIQYLPLTSHKHVLFAFKNCYFLILFHYNSGVKKGLAHIYSLSKGGGLQKIFPKPPSYLHTVEKRIKEPRLFLSSLDTFLISGLIFSIPGYKVLNKVLIYRASFACIFIVFCTRMLDDS